jgi:hypothetical protein
VVSDPKVMLKLARQGTPARTLPTEARQTQLMQHLEHRSELAGPQWECLKLAAESVHAMEQRLQAGTSCQLSCAAAPTCKADSDDDRAADVEHHGGS